MNITEDTANKITVKHMVIKPPPSPPHPLPNLTPLPNTLGAGVIFAITQQLDTLSLQGGE